MVFFEDGTDVVDADGRDRYIFGAGSFFQPVWIDQEYFHFLMGGILAKKLNRFYNPVFYFKTSGILDHFRSFHPIFFCRKKQRFSNIGTTKKRRIIYVFISGTKA
jgi:hypothetical protein